LDLEQSRAGVPMALEDLIHSDAIPENWRYVPWRGSGPGVGGGLIRIFPEEPVPESAK
jgi:hypothetical protein